MIEKKIKGNSEHFCILVSYFFNTKWNRSRCRSRWENLDCGQYRFQPIKFVNSVVPSPCETQPYNNIPYYSTNCFHCNWVLSWPTATNPVIKFGFVCIHPRSRLTILHKLAFLVQFTVVWFIVVNGMWQNRLKIIDGKICFFEKRFTRFWLCQIL